MANRFFNQFQLTLQKQAVTLYAKVSFVGGVATVIDSEEILVPENPTSINPSLGFVGGQVAEPFAGLFRFNLQDPYVRLLGVRVTSVPSSYAGTVPVSALVFEDAVTDQNDPHVSLGFVGMVAGSPATIELLQGAAGGGGNNFPDGVYLLAVDLTNSTAI